MLERVKLRLPEMRLESLVERTREHRSLAVIRQSEIIKWFDDERPLGLGYGHFYHLLDFDLECGIEGKDICEVGGACSPEFVLNVMGAKSWTSIQKTYADKEYERGNQRVIGEDVGRRYKVMQHVNGLEGIFDSGDLRKGTFDGFFSLACFEHVEDLASLLEIMYELAKPVSTVYSFFTPIWASRSSHLEPPLPELRYDFYHLCFNYGTMYALLVSRGIEKRVAARESYLHYKSDALNRLTVEEYRAIFDMCSFSKRTCQLVNEAAIEELDEGLKQRIKKYYPHIRAVCDGFRVVLERGL